MREKYNSLDDIEGHVNTFFDALETVENAIGSLDLPQTAKDRITVYKIIRDNVVWSNDINDLRKNLSEQPEEREPEIKKLIDRWIEKNI